MLDNKNKEYFIWQYSKKPCEACKKLSNSIYEYDFIPAKPHPNCKCKTFGISEILLDNPDYMAIQLVQSETEPGMWIGFLDGLQFVLDIAGLVPVAGEVADGANALIYLGRKDYINASLSGLALVPIAGILSTGGKITAKVVKVVSKADDVADIAKATKNAVTKADDAVDVAKNTNKWIDETGRFKYPPNDGFDGEPVKTILQPGTLIDRYGSTNGSYTSPKGTSFEARSLPVEAKNKPFNTYEVKKPIEVLTGKASPWFDQPGGGMQFKFDKKIQELIKDEILHELN